ncbi:uncharacterized protein GGS22DRAFT_185307 [Annulohypoxylon maeteangense]|uniref:uncharacterized protein n=1 Tax=Annulohypoxylon maeteangense TaxID=1927788 RepID=UPI002007F0BA|nr:uncharacterized protein GGS22DRAFT_185307 [Annulohypoxylon maeteangense]KAI0887925.1 hypothetical protein GGS22DRAFT_185307 [Annulohypoxylon maeteangense]
MQFISVLLPVALLLSQGNCLGAREEAGENSILARQDTIVWEGTCEKDGFGGLCHVPKLNDVVDCGSANPCRTSGAWCSFSWETLEVTCL